MKSIREVANVMLNRLFGRAKRTKDKKRRTSPEDIVPAQPKAPLPPEILQQLNSKNSDQLLAQIRRITQDHPELTVQLLQYWIEQDNKQ